MEEMLKNPTEQSTEAFNAWEPEQTEFEKEATETVGRVNAKEVTTPEGEAVTLGEGFNAEQPADDTKVVLEEKVPQIEPEKPSEPSGKLTGISRKANNIVLEAQGSQKLTAPQTREQTTVLQEAIDGNYSSGADARAAEIVSVRHGKGSRPAPITDVEVAGAIVRKAEISNEMDDLNAARNAAEKAGDVEGAAKFDDKIRTLEHSMEVLTKAVDTSVSENARGMAMMGRFIDRKSFKLADVMNSARTKKGNELTKAERSDFQKLATDLKVIQDLRSEKLESVTVAEAKVLEEFASDAVSEMLSSVKARRTKAEIKAERARIKGKMTKMGHKMHDITGISIETAGILKELAVNYIHDGAITLSEIKNRFMSDFPGEFTEHDLYSALGGRVGKTAQKAKTDAEKVLAEIKAQSKLMSEIDDAFNGIFDPVAPVKKTSNEIKDLRLKLDLLKSSVVNTERDDQRVDSILDSITAMDKMLGLEPYRKIKVIHKKSKDLVEAEKMLSVANKELRAQDRLAVLDEILRTDGEIQKKHIDRSETSQRLEEFRAQIMGLKQLIVKKNAPKKRQEAYKAREKALDAQITALTEEVEGFIRTITPKKETRVEMVARKATKAELLEAKRDQDALAELFTILREKRTPVAKESIVKEDKHGYKDTIKNVRQEIQNTEWHKEWKQTRDEASKNARSKEAIADMEKRLENEDYEGFVTPRQVLMIKSDELRLNKIKEHRLKNEINERIRNLEPKTWVNWAHDIWGIPRSAKLTLDVGHIWRQGGFVLSNPRKMNAFDFTKMSLANFKEENADAWNIWVLDHADYESAKKDGVRIIEIGEQLQGVERLLNDDILEKIPYLGGLVKASARTQLTSLNVLRLSWYSGYKARNPGATPKEMQEMATALNVLTGYGQGKTVSQIAPFLDHLITSGRFTASRYQAPFLIPYAIKKGNKALTKELAEDTAWFWGTRVALMILAASLFPEIEFGTNPDHHTAGKLLVELPNGYTRVYDPWTGMQTVIRLGGAAIRGDDDVVGLLADDLAKKASPQYAFVQGIIHGKDWMGKDINRGEAALRGLAPISIEGIVDSALAKSGMLDMVIGTGADLLGIGSYPVETDSLKGKTKWKDR
jgi:hypothetical protein